MEVPIGTQRYRRSDVVFNNLDMTTVPTLLLLVQNFSLSDILEVLIRHIQARDLRSTPDLRRSKAVLIIPISLSLASAWW